MRAEELREKKDEELKQIMFDRHEDLLHFRMQRATGVVDDVCAARRARQDIARIKTIMNERKRAAAPAGKEEPRS